MGFILPDGSVVNEENTKIGTLYSDIYVIDKDKNIIGGIAPSGMRNNFV